MFTICTSREGAGVIWTLFPLTLGLVFILKFFWNSSLFSLFPPFSPLYLLLPSFLSCFAFSPFAAWWVSPSTAFSRRPSCVLNFPPFSCWPVPSIFCSSHFLPLFIYSFQIPPSSQSNQPLPERFLNYFDWCRSTPNVSLLPSLKPRLSSLTIGDSERKSSATQQREPTADIHAETTGNHNIPSWLTFFFLSLNIQKTTFTSFHPHTPRSWSCPEMRGRAEGPARFRLHSVWRESQASAERPTRWDARTQLTFNFILAKEVLKKAVTRSVVWTWMNTLFVEAHFKTPVFIFTGGAAVKAGVQEGDRIIKVCLTFYHTESESHCSLPVFNPALPSFCLSGERLAGVLHVPSGGGKAHQMWVGHISFSVIAAKTARVLSWRLTDSIFIHLSAGTYVALTLQGPPPSTAALPLEPLPTDISPNQRTSLGGEAPPPPPPPLPSGLSSTPSQRITGPKPLQVNDIIFPDTVIFHQNWVKQICGNIKIVVFIYDICCKRVFQDPEVQKHATQILRKMLEQEEAELQVHTHTSTNNSELKPSTLPPVYIQRSLSSAVISDLITRRDQFTSQDLMEEQSKNPSPSLEERIESAKRRAHQVRVKIQQDLVRRRHWIVNILKALYTHSKLFTSIEHRKWFSSISERFLSDIRPRSDEELK